MKKIATLFLSLFVAATAMAVPAKRTPITVTQPDGTTLTVMMVGDEHFHYFVNTANGEKLFRESSGFFRTATEAELESRLQFSEQRAAESNSRRLAAPSKAATTKYSVLDPDGTTINLHGQKRTLVILVNFADKAWNSKNSTRMPNQMNKVGYDENGHIGSAHDFFYSQSYGDFDLEIDVVGPYTLSNQMSYYGKNDSYGNDTHPCEMVAEACKLAAADSLDFSPYDWDGDKKAEMITIVYAGYGEAQGASANTIWPHQWTLSEGKMYGDGSGMISLGGIKIDKYLCLNELSGTYGTTLDGIGTFCHEFSHSLGLPDIYHTSNSYSNNGMGAWSVMDYGCYNGGGCVPLGYTAYERAFCGWLEPKELIEGCDITGMKALADSAEAYIVYNDALKTEYYLLYNVQKKSWDAEGPGHGMVIMHVDYDETSWANNVVNNTDSHRRCSMFHADNSSDASSAGVAYPGTSKNTKLTDTSSPKASLFNKNTDGSKLMHKPIEDITEQNGLISFKFNGGRQVVVDVPEMVEPTEYTDNSFVAVWNPIADPDATYNLELTKKFEVEGTAPSDVVLINQDFKKLVAGTYQDIADNIDAYTDTKGWTGKRVYVQDGYMKIGSTSIIGNITTPALPISSGALTVRFTATDYSGSDKFEFTFKLTNVADAEADSIYITTTKDQNIVNFIDVPEGEYTLTMSASDTQVKNARFFLYDIAAYDGDFSDEDFAEEDAEASSAPARATRTRKTYYNGLTGTSYEITDLPDNCTCTYRVQAVDGEGFISQWSEPVTIVLGSILDAVSSVSADSANTTIYDLQGRRVNPSAMNKGVYIMNGKLYRF